MSGFTITVKPDDEVPAVPAGFTPGAEVRREGDAAIVAAVTAGTEIQPSDPTTATWVTVKFVNGTTSPEEVTIESWAESGQAVGNADPGQTVTLNLLLGIGESYYVPESNGCEVTRITERNL